MTEAMDAFAKAEDALDAKHWAALTEAADAYDTVTAGISERLMMIELVASSPVAAAARDLRIVAPRLLVGSSAPPDESEARRDAQHWQAMRAAEDALREAIRAELELDR
jgi:hypothetical protein